MSGIKSPLSFEQKLTRQRETQSKIREMLNARGVIIMNKYNVLFDDEKRDKYARDHCNKLANASYDKTNGKWCYAPFTEQGINKPFLPWAKKRAESRKIICNECTTETSDRLLAELKDDKRNIKTYMQFNEEKYGKIDEKYKKEFGAVKRIFSGGSRGKRRRSRGSKSRESRRKTRK